ncbi:MAG: dihydrofolate reductase [Patescibacteria group bacterium]
MILSLIAAIGKNDELGKDNKLLWDMPADMRHFRETTTGHPVIMGRKTFESIGRPLPNRRNIVITRDDSYSHEGVEVVHSLDEAVAFFADSEEEVFCLGGGEIFRQAIDKADRLYITRIESGFDADVFFPTISDDIWKEISREEHASDERNPFPYAFLLYDKIDKNI